MSFPSINPQAGANSTPVNNALFFGDHTGVPQELQDNWRDYFPEIIGRSGRISKVLETVSKIARSDSAVLIFGESGTGKELIAAALHRLSVRSARRFIPINCSAIPEDLLESELFGHEKGAFTGADRRRAGHFEIAAGGTIFLDEIGDMPLRLQAKLLRVLQERQFTPLGGRELIKSDARVVAATNVDLEKAVASGSFRLDLFYRLNVLPIHLPALRERPEDVLDLLQHFLEIANRHHNSSKPCYFTQEVIEILQRYPWPGNIRELQNLVERIVVMRGGGALTPEHLPQEYTQTIVPVAVKTILEEKRPPLFSYPPETVTPEIAVNFANGDAQLPENGINLMRFIESLENNLILQALNRTDNNKNQAAKLLGLNRTTLVERIKKRRLGPLGDDEVNPV